MGGRQEETEFRGKQQSSMPAQQMAEGQESSRFQAGATPLRILIITISGIFLAEVAAMIIVYLLDPLPYALETLIDAVVMTVMIFPLVYFLTFRRLLIHINEQQRAEDALHSANRELVARTLELEQANEVLGYQAYLLDSIGEAIIATDLQGKITAWNRAAEAVYGWSGEQALGSPLEQLMVSKNTSVVWDDILHGLEVNQQFRGDIPQTRRDGDQFIGETTIKLLPNEPSQRAGYVCIVRDISRRKKAEDQVRIQTTALEAAANGIIITDCNGLIVWANQAFSHLTGYDRQEVIGHNPRLLKSGQQGAEFYANMWRTITAGNVWRSELVNRKKDGSLYVEEMTITPVLGEQGIITHYIAIKQDITARKQAEQALEAERKRLFSLLDELPAFVYLRAPDYTIRFANRQFRERFGEPAGRPCYLARHHRSSPCIKCPSEHVFDSGNPVEWEWTAEDGRIYQIYDYPFTDVDGSPLILKLGIDISERKRAEADLVHSLAELDMERARLKNILDNMPDGVYMVDRDCEIEYINPVLERQFGPINERKCYQYFHDRSEACPWCVNERVFKGEIVHWEFQVEKTGKVYDLFDVPVHKSDGSLSKLEIFHDITERKLAEKKLEQNYQELKILSRAEHAQRQLAQGLVETITALNTSLDLADVLDCILEQVYINIPYHAADILLLEKDEATSVRRRDSRYLPVEQPGVKRDYKLAEIVFLQQMRTSQKSILVPDTRIDPGWQAVPGYEWTRSINAAPLIMADRCIGFIILASQQPGFFNDESARRLQAFAAHAAIAIQNARLFEAEQNARQTAEHLCSASQMLTQSLDLDVVLSTLLDFLKRLVPYDVSTIFLMDDDSHLSVKAARGYESWVEPSRVYTVAFDLQENAIMKEMYTSQMSILIPDTRLNPHWNNPLGIEITRSWIGIPLVVEGKVIGVCGLGSAAPQAFSQQHVQLAEALVVQAAVMVQNAWLFGQVLAGRQRMQLLSRRLVEIQETERRYIARELHDEAAQALSSLQVGLRLLEREAANPGGIIAGVKQLNSLVDSVMENLHRLAMDLRPASLDQLGLIAALRQYIENVSDQHQIFAQFEVVGLHQRLAPDTETAMYRIIQEAVSNVVRHARATRLDILLEARKEMLIAVIEDNGVGFDAMHIEQGERMGVIGMQERAEMLGGKLLVESTPNLGTTVYVEVPYVDTNSDC